MATTTPNFGFDIPQSTDLVKDGATAIAALGTDIDTAFVDLKGGTTGQVLAKASGTDLDFSWVAQDDSNAIQNAIVDAKGDLISATAADTPARLAVGTNGQALLADSTTATGLKWGTPASGGMTLLSTTTLSGSNTTISTIDQTYTDLQIVIYGTNNGSNYYPNFKPNNTSNIATYYHAVNFNATVQNQALSATDFGMNYGLRAASNTNNAFTITIYNYASTAMIKNFVSTGFQRNSVGSDEAILSGGTFDTTSAISSLNISASAGTFTAGTVLVYGVK